MASNSTNFTVNRDELIRSAFEMVGVAVAGEPLAPEDINKAVIVLNMMIKAFQAHGLHIWKRTTVTFPFVAAQTTYTLGQKSAGVTTSAATIRLIDTSADFVADGVATGDKVRNVTSGVDDTVAYVSSKTEIYLTGSNTFTSFSQAYEITSASVSTPRPLTIIEANRVLSDGTSITMNPLSLEEYESLPNKAQTGTPISYFYNPTLNNGTISVWLTPDAIAASLYTMRVITSATIEDINHATDSFDCPSEWLEALTVNLAYRLSHRYPLESTSAKVELKGFAKEALELALNFDVEDTSTFFVPQTERGQ
jgi:hypothetical protein